MRNLDFWRRCLCLLVSAIFVTVGLVFDKVVSGSFVILLLVSITLWFWPPTHQLHSDQIGRRRKVVVMAFAAYFVVGVVAWLLGGQSELGFKILGRDLRFALAIPVVILLSIYRPSIDFVVRSFGTSGIVLGAYSILFMVFVEGSERLSGATISIVFGHLSASVFSVNAVYLFFRRKNLFFHMLAMTGAVTAVWCSGTRGALLIVLAIAFSLLVALIVEQRRSMVLSTLVAVLVAAMVMISAREDRYIDGLQEVKRSIQRFNALSQLEDGSELPACITNSEFQKWLVENLRVEGAGVLKFSYHSMAEPWSSRMPECNTGTYVRVSNSSSSHGWVFFPARTIPEDAGIAASFMIRGQATIGLARSAESERLEIDASTPTRIDLPVSSRGDGRALLVLYPGQQLDLVPVQIRHHEFRAVAAGDSLIARLVMWNEAVRMFVENPVFGVGVGQYRSSIKERVTEGAVAESLARYDHPHNELLTVAAERGIFGIFSLLGLYGLPIWFFLQFRGVIGFAGVVFVVSFVISGFSETIFNHSFSISFYVLCLAIFMGSTMVSSDGKER